MNMFSIKYMNNNVLLETFMLFFVISANDLVSGKKNPKHLTLYGIIFQGLNFLWFRAWNSHHSYLTQLLQGRDKVVIADEGQGTEHVNGLKREGEKDDRDEWSVNMLSDVISKRDPMGWKVQALLLSTGIYLVTSTLHRTLNTPLMDWSTPLCSKLNFRHKLPWKMKQWV